MAQYRVETPRPERLAVDDRVGVARAADRRDDLERALGREPEITAAVRAAGYGHAVIDRQPFRSGRLNAVLRNRA